MTPVETAWLAGILEGEGYFHFRTTPQIVLSMTDEDIIARVAKLFGKGYVNVGHRQHQTKDVFRTYIFANGALMIMEAILPFMGKRRSAKIRAIKKLSAARPGCLWGQDCNDSRITDRQARYIKREYEKHYKKYAQPGIIRVLADRFGVSYQGILYNVTKRKACNGVAL